MLDRLGIGIHLSDSLGTQQTIALISIAVYTLLNAVGVKVVALINNSAVVFEALGLLVFAVILALFHHHHGVEVYSDTGGAGFTGGAVLVALFVGLWVMYGFDTASTLAEESVDPRRNAPRSIIAALTAAFVTGGIFIAAMLLAVPGVHQGRGSGLAVAGRCDLGQPVQRADGRLPRCRRHRGARHVPGDPGVDDPPGVRARA